MPGLPSAIDSGYPCKICVTPFMAHFKSKALQHIVKTRIDVDKLQVTLLNKSLIVCKELFKDAIIEWIE